MIDSRQCRSLAATTSASSSKRSTSSIVYRVLPASLEPGHAARLERFGAATAAIGGGLPRSFITLPTL